ncbi:hypothetical protein CKF54_06805 [Psittacicella hinzii]|uniref:Single-stranded DNA-binding protein n=1 Tax=Psittacicella hinzii TaxID=2028575 RepID=A0A3A1Y235_9GAMM|nr:single-stranded DNA-binding protein [Psittacicella hinzii]RIY31369.1 hypothetical protein CKF54_06805 [Psittacicella hinzii]
MAMYLNKVYLVGNVGRDPEFFQSRNGEFAAFSLATSTFWLDRTTNQWQSNTDWHRIVCYNERSVRVIHTIAKGSLVFVEGSIKSRKYLDKLTNTERTSIEIQADTVQALIRPPRNNENQYGDVDGYGNGNYGNNSFMNNPNGNNYAGYNNQNYYNGNQNSYQNQNNYQNQNGFQNSNSYPNNYQNSYQGNNWANNNGYSPYGSEQNLANHYAPQSQGYQQNFADDYMNHQASLNQWQEDSGAKANSNFGANQDAVYEQYKTGPQSAINPNADLVVSTQYSPEDKVKLAQESLTAKQSPDHDFVDLDLLKDQDDSDFLEEKKAKDVKVKEKSSASNTYESESTSISEDDLPF